MCKYLDSASFMVFVFTNISEESPSLSFSKLRKIRDEVSSSLQDQNVFIEWTRNSVLGAVECFYDIFKQDDAHVIWHGTDKTYVRESFNNNFSKDFEDKLDYAIKAALQSITTPS